MGIFDFFKRKKKKDNTKDEAEQLDQGALLEQPDQESPAKKAPAKKAPAKKAPAKKAPAKKAPAKKAPAKKAPAEKAPAEKAPAKKAPAQKAPAEKAPAKKAPTKKAPTKKAPAEKVPTQKAPAKKVPVKKPSTEEVSTPEVSVPETSIPEVPTQEASAQEVSTQEASTPEVYAQEDPIQEVSTPEDPVQEISVPDDPVPEDPIQDDPIQEDSIQDDPTQDKQDENKSEESGQEEIAKKSWFGRLKDGLGKSAGKITSGFAGVIGKPKLDASDLDEIEDALIMADLGVAAASRLTEGLKKRSFPDGVTKDSLAKALAEDVAEILAPVAKPLQLNPSYKPHVILMVGVNGSGKTTTAGKLAEQWQREGKTVMMAAADTFRAAAVEQLKIWGERTGTTVIAGEQGSDAAAVAFQAYEKAIAEKVDVLIIDTAGRLQAKAELMDELAKICRVVGKKDATAPHDRIIVLDGTVGQNASSQVSAFIETADLTGMIVTKLDGSARGGVVIALAESFGLPIHAVGVGESKDDLRAFDALDFGRALAGLGADE